jgi:hypothetical protein
MIAQVGYLVAERLRGRISSCAVCTVHVEMRCACFLVKPQNQSRRFVSGLTSKSLGRFLISLGLKIDDDGLWVVWPQNHSYGFHWFDLKTVGDDFSSVWASKPMVMVCRWFDLETTRTVFYWFVPQNRWWQFVSCLTLKPLGWFFIDLISKSVATVSDGLTSKPAATVSGGLASKPAATVFDSLNSKPAAMVSGSWTSKPAVRVS